MALNEAQKKKTTNTPTANDEALEIVRCEERAASAANRKKVASAEAVKTKESMIVARRNADFESRLVDTYTKHESSLLGSWLSEKNPGATAPQIILLHKQMLSNDEDSDWGSDFGSTRRRGAMFV